MYAYKISSYFSLPCNISALTLAHNRALGICPQRKRLQIPLINYYFHSFQVKNKTITSSPYM